jgi:hypothetical protein
MRKVLLLLTLLAFLPTLRYPVLGQEPGIGGKRGVKKPDGETSANQDGKTDQRGTKKLPFIVDTEGHQQTETEKRQASEKEDRTREVVRWTLYFAQLAAWATVALVFIGLGGVGAAIWTLRQIKRQADLQERAIRPWIGTVRISDGILQPDGPGRMAVRTTVKLKNTGPSVALQGLMLPFLIPSRTSELPNAIKSRWKQVEDMLKAKSETEWETGFVLHPGATHIHEVFMGTDMPLPGIQAGLCWVLVCIVYRDQFGKEHRTQDCFQTGGVEGNNSAMRFKAIPAHQTAD